MSHTNEPWSVEGEETMQPLVVSGEKLVASTFWNDDARRIVAAVNACAGVSDDALEVFAKYQGLPALDAMLEEIRLLKKQRDELLAALEKQVADAKHCQQVMLNEVGIGFLDVVTLANSESAIARVKGGAA